MPDEANRVDVLQRLVLQERAVDLIALGPYLNLVHTDDKWYADFPVQYKNKTIYELAAHQKPQATPIGNIDDFITAFGVVESPFEFLIAHYAKHYGNFFTLCDIGAQYGSFTMTPRCY